jgi:hypothetical protein
MIRLTITIQRDDRPPWQCVEMYADLCDHDFSELVTANRFAKYIKRAPHELELEARHSPPQRP